MSCTDKMYLTGNEICSDNPRDLSDNARVFDAYVNSAEFSVTDRFGTPRLTISGIENKVNDRADDAIGRFEGEIDAIIKDAGGVEIVNRWVDSIDKVPSAGFIKGNLGYVTPEMFGAVGDGLADDSNAIEIAFSQSLPVFAVNSYRITRDIVIDSTSSHSIYGFGRGSIKWDYKNMTHKSITFRGVKVLEKKLTSKKYINTNKWEIDTSGVMAGMLMEVRSSRPWYTDPRTESTDARVSELHVVRSLDDGVITTDIPSNDSYNMAEGETVTVNFYEPVQVYFSGMSIKSSKQPYSNDNVKSINGLNIINGINTVVIDNNLKNMVSTGVSLNGCYNSFVSRNKIDGCNDYFTGYGVQTLGCTLSKIKENTITGSRRGVDISGWGVISLLSIVESNTVISSGKNSRGQVYGWDEWSLGAYCSGIGTHGGSDKAIFKGNIMYNLHTGVVIRSPNNNVDDNEFYGRFNDGVNCARGWNVNISRNFASEQYSNKGSLENPPGVANSNGQYMRNFVKFQDDWKYNVPSYITNNNCRVNSDFISIQNGGMHLTVTGNTIQYTPITGSLVSYILSIPSGKNMDLWDLQYYGNLVTDKSRTMLFMPDSTYNNPLRYSNITTSVKSISKISVSPLFNAINIGESLATYTLSGSTVKMTGYFNVTVGDAGHGYVNVKINNAPHVTPSNTNLSRRNNLGVVTSTLNTSGNIWFENGGFTISVAIPKDTGVDTAKLIYFSIEYDLRY